MWAIIGTVILSPCRIWRQPNLRFFLHTHDNVRRVLSEHCSVLTAHSYDIISHIYLRSFLFLFILSATSTTTSSSTSSTSAAFYVFHNMRYLFVICSFLLLHAFWKYTFGVFPVPKWFLKSHLHCVNNVQGDIVYADFVYFVNIVVSHHLLHANLLSFSRRRMNASQFLRISGTREREKKMNEFLLNPNVGTYVTWLIRQSQVTSTYLHLTFSNLLHNGCYLMENLICMEEEKQWKSKEHLLHLVCMQKQSTIVWSLKIHVFKLDVFHFIIHLTNSLYFILRFQSLISFAIIKFIRYLISVSACARSRSTCTWIIL